MTPAWLLPLCALLAQAETSPLGPGPVPPPVAQPPEAAAAPPPAQPPPLPSPPAPPPPPPRPAPAARPPVLLSPFRLSLTYVHVLREDGDLVDPNLSTNAVGIDMAFPSNTYVRNHLGLATQWESKAGRTTARGFRVDLISLGYPITLTHTNVRLDLEPVLTVVRGELMFPTDGGRMLRVESGFSLELSATARQWFLMLQLFGIDFRYWVYTSAVSLTGFSQIFPVKVAVGHEF